MSSFRQESRHSRIIFYQSPGICGSRRSSGASAGQPLAAELKSAAAQATGPSFAEKPLRTSARQLLLKPPGRAPRLANWFLE